MKAGGGNKSGGGNRRCFKCGSSDHLIRDCPEGGGSRKDTNPRYIPPNSSKGESKEKTVDGVKHIWCGKCRGGKGIWTVGGRAHHTHEHRSNPGLEDNDGDKTTDEKGSGGTNTSPKPQANMGYVDEPLVFGFFSPLWTPSDEDDDDHATNANDEDPLDMMYPKGSCGEW